MIAERQRKYPVWRLIHLLASLKLAMLLIGTIAIAIAVATFTETRFDSAVARAWIYKAPWFIAWLGVLCINLFAVTLSRWPWQKQHTGFIITHYGIILLLIGAVIGSKLGFEGNVTLRTDGQPLRRIVTDRSTLQIESPADSYLYLLPFDAKLTHPTKKHPTILGIPGTTLEMVIDDSSEHLVHQPQLVPRSGEVVGAAVLMDFTSGNLSQSLRIGLGNGEGSPDHQDFFGLAKIAFFRKLPAHGESNAATTLIVTAGNLPEQGVSLSKDGGIVFLHSPDGLATGYRVSDVINHQISLGSLKATVQGVLSHQPQGMPAIRVELSSENPAEADQKPWLELAPGDVPDTATYQLGRAGEILSSGILKIGDLLPLGWADWKLKLLAAGSSHSVTTILEPAQVPAGGESSEGLPGFHAYLREKGDQDQQGEAVWVASGEVTPLLLGENLVRVGYGLELRAVPFSIGLTDFQVPRDEGTDTPSDFRATVLFKNLKTGVEKTGLIRMNHPASYPGGLLANLTGFNYKFSQAEWNPRDLKETTLQVLYDPGWFFKWVGSLAICLGIATMFYIRPRS